MAEPVDLSAKERAELKLRRAQMARNPFCPDHRDKVHGKPCRECEIEHLRSIIRQQQPPLSLAPCDRCGYRGEGYYQPDKHPCAGGAGKSMTVAWVCEQCGKAAGERKALDKVLNEWGIPDKKAALDAVCGALEQAEALARTLARALRDSQFDHPLLKHKSVKELLQENGNG